MSDDASEIRFIGHLQRLDMRPGDRFVLTCDRHLPIEKIVGVQEAWRAYMANIGLDPVPDLIVLDGGLKLGSFRIVSEEEP